VTLRALILVVRSWVASIKMLRLGLRLEWVGAEPDDPHLGGGMVFGLPIF
jgi:hypothetical protein